MTHTDPSPTGVSDRDGANLRLLWPQWQGAGTPLVEAAAAGMAVLEAVLPPHDGPTASVPVAMSDDGLEERDGVEAEAVVLEQLADALEVISRHGPARIVTTGGDFAVSVVPFSELARRYGNDLAVVWIDSHPDVSTPGRQYLG